MNCKKNYLQALINIPNALALFQNLIYIES